MGGYPIQVRREKRRAVLGDIGIAASETSRVKDEIIGVLAKDR